MAEKIMSKFKDLSGIRFNKWTVLHRVLHQSKSVKYSCLCDCGCVHIVQSGHLKSGASKKCLKCSRSEIKHGLTKTPEYHAWIAIKSRCYNKKDKRYKYYGEKGVTISENWIDSFETFLKDMGSRPSKKHSLDRIDCSAEYSKNNCRWTVSSVQALNKRERENTGIRFLNGLWRARITINYKEIGLGSFSTKQEAKSAYQQYKNNVIENIIKENL